MLTWEGFSFIFDELKSVITSQRMGRVELEGFDIVRLQWHLMRVNGCMEI